MISLMTTLPANEAAPTIEGGYGLMALRANAWGGDSLRLAARLLGREPQSLIADATLNLRGAVALGKQPALRFPSGARR